MLCFCNHLGYGFLYQSAIQEDYTLNFIFLFIHTRGLGMLTLKTQHNHRYQYSFYINSQHTRMHKVK